MVAALKFKRLFGFVPFFPISAGFLSVDSVHKTPHKGVDIAIPDGSPLYALGNGVVSRVNDEGVKSFGKSLRLKLDDGTEVIYGHLSQIKAYVGQQVHAGDLVALSGNTGNSTGSHLHLQMMSEKGNLIDPTPIAHMSWWQNLNPFGLISNGTQQIADKVLERVTPSISKVLGLNDKITELAAHLHQKALRTPDPSDDNIDFVKYLYDWADKSAITHFAPEWMKDIVIYFTALFAELSNNATTWLLTGVYKLVSSIVIWTPEFLFGNSWFPQTITKFSALSLGLVSVVAMFEGLKRICRLDSTPLTKTLKRLPIALLVSGLAPFLFSFGVKILNKATKIILDLGSSEMVNSLDLSLTSLSFQPLNILMMIGFALLFAYMCIPMFIFHGKRWFELLVTGMMTPFAMSASLFDSTEQYFHLWYNSIKKAISQQLIYAAFVSAMGILMFATPNPDTITGVFTKLLIMIGGIHKLAYPPHFITGGDHTSMRDMANELNRKRKEFFNKDKDGEVSGMLPEMKTKSENVLVGSAGIAGKIFRFLKRK